MTEEYKDLKADLDAIEANIMAGDMSAHQVFTMMRQMVVAAGGHRITISMTEEDKERLVALSQQPGQILESPLPVALPEGWKLVPVEPTVEMREEYHQANAEWDDGGYDAPDHQWAAMLAAAPTAPQVAVPELHTTATLDEIDAASEGMAYLRRVIDGRQSDRNMRLETFGLRMDDPTAQPNGGVQVLWSGNDLLAFGLYVRGAWNRTTGVFGSLSAAPTPDDQGQEPKLSSLLAASPLKRDEVIELERILMDLDRVLRTPGDWGYGTKLGRFTLEVKRILAALRSSEEAE